MSFNLGDVVPLSVTVRDADGALANAGSVAVTVTLPDGTSATPSVTNDEAGVYNADYVTTQAGVHQVRWVATGANASAFEDAFSVGSAAGLNFISLAETKVHLRKDPTKIADDAEIAEFITATCSKIVELIGPVTPVTVVDTVPCRAPLQVVVLKQHPVISITSVTVDGVDVPEADAGAGVAGWILDPGPGLLGHSRGWSWGQMQVTYRAGRTPLPGNVRLAALELVKHLWTTIKYRQGGARPGVPGDDTITVAGQAYALPNRVRELLGLGRNQTSDVMVG